MAWRKIADKEKFLFKNKGDTLTGKLVGCRKTRFDCNVYDLTTKDGKPLYFFGSATLDSTLPEHIGEVIQIIYLGKIEIEAGRELREYDVQVWDASAREVKDTDKGKKGKKG